MTAYINLSGEFAYLSIYLMNWQRGYKLSLLSQLLLFRMIRTAQICWGHFFFFSLRATTESFLVRNIKQLQLLWKVLVSAELCRWQQEVMPHPSYTPLLGLQPTSGVGYTLPSATKGVHCLVSKAPALTKPSGIREVQDNHSLHNWDSHELPTHWLPFSELLQCATWAL